MGRTGKWLKKRLSRLELSLRRLLFGYWLAKPPEKVPIPVKKYWE
jgi:hypothetical protein